MLNVDTVLSQCHRRWIEQWTSMLCVRSNSSPCSSDKCNFGNPWTYLIELKFCNICYIDLLNMLVLEDTGHSFAQRTFPFLTALHCDTQAHICGQCRSRTHTVAVPWAIARSQHDHSTAIVPFNVRFQGLWGIHVCHKGIPSNLICLQIW